MRGRRALAVGLGLVCAAAVAGCGMSSPEIIKPRSPSGQETRGPDVSVEAIDELRAVKVTIRADRFQPQQVSVGIDSSVRIVNGDDKTVYIRALEGLGDPIEDPELEPEEEVELEFLDAGTERIGLRGSKAKLEINVWPTG